MNGRVAVAEAALQAGHRDEAIEGLIAALIDDPALPSATWLLLARQLYLAGRHIEGEVWATRGVATHPDSWELCNIRGVMLRTLRRHPEALTALDRAIVLAPREIGPAVNRGSVLIDQGEHAAAEAVFADLARRDPGNPGHPLQLGRARARLGRRADAEAAFRQALALQPDHLDAWLQLAGLSEDAGDPAGAEAVLDAALAARPQAPRLLEAHVLLLRRSGQAGRAEANLRAMLPRLETEAWLHMHLGDLVSMRDRRAGNAHLRRAVELQPSLDHIVLLLQSLGRTFGEDEGASLDEAHALARRALDMGGLGAGHTSLIAEVLLRVVALDDFARLGDFAELGRNWARSGRHTALFRLLSRVRRPEDRLELLEQHRIWGRSAEAVAAANPVRHPAPRPANGRIRLGLMSSDLRRHPVGYFAQPLFDHLDRDRFELHAYSFFQGGEDAMQARFASQASVFRWLPDAGSRAAAQAIADDRLDMLVELGGSTHMNRLEIMAWRPALRQASWLGYPHSAGLEAIDHLICDPFSVPPDRDLLLETPLLMPHSWIALGAAVFNDEPAIHPALPQDRAGALTFGTANNPHKYTAEALSAWARVTAAFPGARFAFLRPEGASATFRRHVLARFAAEGVEAGRVIFHAVRGGHMPVYNAIDITLDTFPLTGGATTVEALWMGAPVVSLKGPAFYERLSHSILSNAGLGDLVADDVEGFIEIALRLAADRQRRAALRQSLRQQIRLSPLGRTEDFARDFYDMIARRVGER